MQLLPWSHTTSAGVTLRGWHSPPSGKPLLHFLHGNGFCGRVYEPLLVRLTEEVDLWLCDIQGHGDSDYGGRFLGWNRNAELALEAFDSARERFAEAPRLAAGHSFGGVLTSLILARQPHLFSRAVLLDPVLFNPTMIGVLSLSEALGLHRHTTLARRAWARRSHWPDGQSARDTLHGRGIFKGWTEHALQAYVEHAIKAVDNGVELKCRPSREAEIFSSCPKRLWPSLACIITPTLILHGRNSYSFVARSVARLSALNGHVSAQMVEGGHCFMQEFPEDCAARMLDFLLRPA